MSTINANWNSLRTTLTLTADIDGASSVFIQAGYTPNFYSFEGKNTLELTGLEHADGNPLYVRAVGLDSAGEELVETEVFTTLPIPHPILGIVKDCEKDRNIVDIVEIKNGRPTPRYQSGQRVVRIGTVNVNFYVDDELYLTKKVCAGQPMEQPDDPELPEGCELAYWAEYNPTPIEEGKTVLATFIPGGKQRFNYEWVKPGETIPEPNEPVGKCPFHGWYVKEG